MNKKTPFKPASSILATLIATIFLASCSTAYKSQEVSFRYPTSYNFSQDIAGAKVAVEAFADKNRAKSAFGFDILGAGVLPVQIVIDNEGTHGLEVVPAQTFLIDSNGRMWNILDNIQAYERLEKSSEFTNIAKSSGAGAALGAAGGALVGAAVGILSGRDIGKDILKGAGAGAAGGALVGGAQGLNTDEVSEKISNDLARKQLKNRPVEPENLARGFMFFPAEASGARQLRLQLKETDTGKIHTVTLIVN
ncbi:MAG: hypothetical protein ACP5SG_05385 [Dissulfurimicrobium sp.]|uniref:hypothetical protein n=1 Tax=Dissulfurimicrobium TaxID=1769732 RepID=UPI001EDB8C20|nr:hypothetical protein [Dissulfurimicrobium hydrothermale]UKL13904.1 hypothetical protein LGS26_01170 [Dissulfurimicrobium hydrothermale]